MPKFPEPPSVPDLSKIRPDLLTLPASTELWRVYFRGGGHPTLWNDFRAYGPTNGRFDHHQSPARVQIRKTLYAAQHGLTTFAEAFQEDRVIDRGHNAPWLVAFRVTQALTLLDLTGTWPTRAGASMAINSGQRPRARRWSCAIYDAYPTIDGLFYASSMHANQPAVALYERAEPALPLAPTFHRALADVAMLTVLKRAAEDLNFHLV